MHTSSLLALALAAVSVLAAPSSSDTDTKGMCGSVPTSDQVDRAEAHFAANKISQQAVAPQSAIINVYWHVVSEGKETDEGNLSDSAIAEWIKFLNEGFAKTGLSFKLANTTRTINTQWSGRACPGTTYQTNMKKAFKQGKVNELDIYYTSLAECAEPGYTLDGYATFPVNYTSAPQDDGIVLGRGLLPRSHLLTHEAGHWVGLYHTFQGGCTGTGDGVADTPPEAEPAYRCPSRRDSCPGDGLDDPIHNFMDYTWCRTEFTPGQIDRMKSQIKTYRNITI